jgi:BlaI family transcriptional regulator, penicillinase repressor
VARSGSQTLTEREAQIMGVLWSHRSATAEQVRDLLPDRPHDSTVRTLLRILETKGYVAREGPGRPAHYRALVSQAKAQRSALHSLLIQLFGGSPQALVQRLIDDLKLTPEEFQELAHQPPPKEDPIPARLSARRTRGPGKVGKKERKPS